MIKHKARQIGGISILIGVMLMLVACSGRGDRIYASVSPSSLEPGGPIPQPTEQVILTITGNIAVKNVGDTLVFDIPTLERLGLVEYTIRDPWLKAEVTYTDGSAGRRTGEFLASLA